VNIEKCILLALCHDMGESVVGDIPTYAGVPKGKCVSPRLFNKD